MLKRVLDWEILPILTNDEGLRFLEKCFFGHVSVAKMIHSRAEQTPHAS